MNRPKHGTRKGARIVSASVAIEGQGCACDDPGLQGAMIGAPIGTVAGAILGVRLF